MPYDDRGSSKGRRFVTANRYVNGRDELASLPMSNGVQPRRGVNATPGEATDLALPCPSADVVDAAHHRRPGPRRRRGREPLAKHGPNRLPEGKQRGPLMRFLAQFNNVLVYVLLGAGFTKLMLGLWIDASIILGVVILNGLLGFIQEGKRREGARLDPQHAVGRGADRARRRDAHDPGRGAGAGRRRAARVRATRFRRICGSPT